MYELYKGNFLLVMLESWAQEGALFLCVPILGATLSVIEYEDGVRVYNAAIPLLFFDVVFTWGTQPNDESDH